MRLWCKSCEIAHYLHSVKGNTFLCVVPCPCSARSSYTFNCDGVLKTPPASEPKLAEDGRAEEVPTPPIIVSLTSIVKSITSSRYESGSCTFTCESQNIFARDLLYSDGCGGELDALTSFRFLDSNMLIFPIAGLFSRYWEALHV